MSIQNISSVNNVNFKGNQADKKTPDIAQPKNSIEDGEEKLVLALDALGAVAAAEVANKNTQKATPKIENVIDEEKIIKKPEIKNIIKLEKNY